ncbi:MAG: PhzF family phenazine biosynthesis protein [Desulfovibrio sp.]|nr:PhzF family phenazine biosynthesis protein [Desulfovibrio sp.]
MRQFIVDAFTDKPFSGNPAAVCLLPSWPADRWMRGLAMENNLSETAFLVPEGASFRLRWFTPETEVGLCGHATLASAFVVLELLEPGREEVEFITGEGVLPVRRQGELFAMDFPLIPQREIPVTEAMTRAFGARPLKALLGTDLVCVFESEEMVRGLKPDQQLLAELEGRGQHATAPAKEGDCASRSFFPKLGIAEDPVCGSAHCQIAPYWAGEFKKDAVVAVQASRRGGILYCRLTGNGRVEISGKACLFAISEIQPAALPR